MYNEKHQKWEKVFFFPFQKFELSFAVPVSKHLDSRPAWSGLLWGAKKAKCADTILHNL